AKGGRRPHPPRRRRSTPTAPPRGGTRIDGDEWTESPSLSDFLRLVGELFLVRERLPDEDLTDLAVVLQHGVAKRAEDRRPREGVDAHLPVGLRAYRVVHLGDDALHAEDLLGDLCRHQVPVVALGEGQGRIRPLHARLPEDIEIGPVAEDRLALDGWGQMRVPGPLGARWVMRRDVHDADAMPLGVEQTRQESTHAATADNDDVHLVSS